MGQLGMWVKAKNVLLHPEVITEESNKVKSPQWTELQAVCFAIHFT